MTSKREGPSTWIAGSPGPGYRSQRETPTDRAFKLLYRLGAEGGIGDTTAKPGIHARPLVAQYKSATLSRSQDGPSIRSTRTRM